MNSQVIREELHAHEIRLKKYIDLKLRSQGQKPETLTFEKINSEEGIIKFNSDLNYGNNMEKMVTNICSLSKFGRQLMFLLFRSLHYKAPNRWDCTKKYCTDM
jgi:hypothetical protein